MDSEGLDRSESAPCVGHQYINDLSFVWWKSRHFFQGVHMLLTFGSSAEGLGQPWQLGEKRVNKLVFIGRNLDREQLRAGFQACII